MDVLHTNVFWEIEPAQPRNIKASYNSYTFKWSLIVILRCWHSLQIYAARRWSSGSNACFIDATALILLCQQSLRVRFRKQPCMDSPGVI